MTWLDDLAALPPSEAEAVLAAMTDQEVEALAYDWPGIGRPLQRAPAGDWTVWLNMSGRGCGKTRSGAEWVREQREAGVRWIGLVAETAGDARNVMVEGESGILSVCPPWDMPRYEPSKRRLTWDPTERYPWRTVATTFSGDKPGQLRGPNLERIWCDELAKYKYAKETLDNAEMTLRRSKDPRMYITTTPIPCQLLRDLAEDPDCVVTREATFANAGNLPAKFLRRMRRKYEGTRLGRQELYGELLADIEGALWTGEQIQRDRGKRFRWDEDREVWVPAPVDFYRPGPKEKWQVFDHAKGDWRDVPGFRRTVVAVDPAASEAGRVGVCVLAVGEDGHGYVLRDASVRGSTPAAWAARVVGLYEQFKADRVVAEVNQGGYLVEETIRTVSPHIPYTAVRAAEGKRTRAEPVSALYEQGKVHHLGMFSDLEDQMTTWVPDSGDPSPDNLDALVWAGHDQMLREQRRTFY